MGAVQAESEVEIIGDGGGRKAADGIEGGFSHHQATAPKTESGKTVTGTLREEKHIVVDILENGEDAAISGAIRARDGAEKRIGVEAGEHIGQGAFIEKSIGIERKDDVVFGERDGGVDAIRLTLIRRIIDNPDWVRFGEVLDNGKTIILTSVVNHDHI